MKALFSRLFSKPPAPLIPILCQGPGRTGFTLLMELLLTSDEVLPEPLFPHENRMLDALALASLAFWQVPEEFPPLGRAAQLRAIHQALEIRPVWPWVADDLSKKTSETLLWREIFETNWSLLSARLRTRRPQGKYYAEKGSPGVAGILKKAKMPHRILLRSRDPRDHWCSLAAFNAKRGYELDNKDLPLRSVVERLPLFIDAIKSHYAPFLGKDFSDPLPSKVHLVKYEELVTDLPSVAASIEQRFRIKLHPQLALERTELHPEHRTSSSPKQSIGRWKKDLDPEIGTVLEKELRPIYEKLGYDWGE